MRLDFNPEDEADDERFHVTLGQVEKTMAEWLREQVALGQTDLTDDEIAELCGDARMALDFKFHYGDGKLADWTGSDVREYLLDYCPRKVSAPPDLAAAIPSGLVALFHFLHGQGWLVGSDHRLSRLIKEVESNIGAFIDAMADPAQFGMAKSLFSAMGVDSLDGLGEDAIGNVMAGFNALPEDERRAALGPSPFDDDDDPFDRHEAPRLPAVALPERRAADASSADSRLVCQLRLLADFLGDGRKLTKKNNLTLADARALVEALDTGDEIDTVIGDKVFKTQSAAELYGLQRVFAVAKKAGVIRVQHGKAMATKRGRTFGDKPLESLQRASLALIDLGPIESGRGDREHWLSGFDEMADENALGMLTMLYARQAPVAVADLGELLAGQILDEYRFDQSSYWTDDKVADQAVVLVDRLVDAFELAGLLRRQGGETSERWPGVRGGVAELTPAGSVVLHDLLVADGFDAPTIDPELAQASALELLDGLVEVDDFDRCLAESLAWRNQRTPEAAVTEIVAVLPSLDGARSRMAFQILRDLGPGVATAEVRSLEDSDAAHVRALARTYRAEASGLFADPEVTDSSSASTHRDLESPEDRTDALAEILVPTDQEAFLFVIADRLVADGPSGLLETMELLLSPDEQASFLAVAFRIDDPFTLPVLEAIAALSPHKTVSKAARKATMQHRSHVANLRS